MLAELMVANAAFAVIKQTLSNGKELIDAGDSLGKYFKAENDIAKEVENKGKANVLEAYQAQQTLRKNEEDLKFMLNKQGLLGYHNFIVFKAEYNRSLKKAKKAKAKQKYLRAQAFEENFTLGIKVFGTLLLVLAALFGVAFYIRP